MTRHLLVCVNEAATLLFNHNTMAPGVLSNCELSKCALLSCSPHRSACPPTSPPLLWWCVTLDSRTISYNGVCVCVCLLCVCVCAATPGGGLWWSIPRARQRSGWKTWRGPTPCISSNWLMPTLCALWRTASSSARQVSARTSPAWCSLCRCHIHMVAVSIAASWGLSSPQWPIIALHRVFFSFVLCSAVETFI